MGRSSRSFPHALLPWCLSPDVVCVFLQVIACGFWAPENPEGRRLPFSGMVFLKLLVDDQKQASHGKLPAELLQLLKDYVTETRARRVELASVADAAAGGKPASTGPPKQSALNQLAAAVGVPPSTPRPAARPALPTQPELDGPGIPDTFSDRFPLLISADQDMDSLSSLRLVESRIDALLASSSASDTDLSPFGVTAVQRGVEHLSNEDWKGPAVDWLRASYTPLHHAAAAGSAPESLTLDSSSKTIAISVSSLGFGGDKDCIPIEVAPNPTPSALNPPSSLNPKP